jgi:hypothetical protein
VTRLVQRYRSVYSVLQVTPDPKSEKVQRDGEKHLYFYTSLSIVVMNGVSSPVDITITHRIWNGGPAPDRLAMLFKPELTPFKIHEEV